MRSHGGEGREWRDTRRERDLGLTHKTREQVSDREHKIIIKVPLAATKLFMIRLCCFPFSCKFTLILLSASVMALIIVGINRE